MASSPNPDSDQLIKDVGMRIAEIRALRGVTQESMAEQMGTSVQYQRRVEAGENLTLRSLARFAAELGVSVADFLVPPTTRKRTRGRPPRKRAGP